MEARRAVLYHISDDKLAGRPSSPGAGWSGGHAWTCRWFLAAHLAWLLTGTAFASASGSGRSVTLAWEDNDTNAFGYTVVFSIEGKNGMFSQDAGTNLSWSVPDLEPAATYRFEVLAYNDYRLASDPSDPVYWTTSTELVAMNGDQSVRLRWLTAATALGYVVKRSESPGGPYTIVTTTAASTWVDRGLVNGQSYYYRVAVLTAAGESPDSEEVVGVPDVAPDGLYARGTPAGARLVWNALPDVSSYTLYRADEAGGPYNPIAVVSPPTEYVDTSVLGGRAYYYVVAGERTGGGPTAYSEEALAIMAPSPPQALEASLFAAGVVQLTWSTSDPLVDEVVIEWSADGIAFAAFDSAFAGETNYLVGVDPSSEYFFRVNASNAGGNSDYSNVASVKTPAYGLNIEFGTTASAAVAGYVTDTGELFGPKPGGLIYGWNAGPVLTGVQRRSPLSPDARYDSFIQPSAGNATNAARTWEIEVPNDYYSVRLMAGDPLGVDETFEFLVGGGRTTAGAPAGQHWFCFTNTVRVEDGRLTIAPSPGVPQDKLCFVDIYATVPISPALALSPSSQTVTQNDAVELAASVAAGSPPLSLQWFHDGILVPGATSNIWTLPHVQRAEAGEYYLVVSNLVGSVTSEVARVTVIPTDFPPQLSPISVQNLLEDTPSVVRFQLSDADNPVTAVALEVHSDNPGLLPDTSLRLSPIGEQMSLVLSPAPDQSGSAVVTLRATDSDNHAVTQSFLVNVAAVNDPPTLDPLSSILVLTNCGSQTVRLSGISSGAPDEQQAITLSVDAAPAAMLSELRFELDASGNAGVLRFTPAEDAQGRALITVTVDDGQPRNNRFQRSFTVTVGTNAAGPLFIEAECGDRVSPVKTQPDPRAFNGRYVFSPNSNEGSTSFQVDLSADGEFVIWCRILSISGATDSFFVSLDGGAEEIYDTVLSSAPADSWQWTRVNGRISGNPRLFAMSAGIHTLTFRTRESYTLLDALWVTTNRLFVPADNPTNAPPTLNAISNLTLYEDAPVQAVLLSGITSGAASEQQPLLLQATSSNPGLIPDPAIVYQSPDTAGLLTFAPTPQATGTATIRVVVNDGGFGNNLASRLFTVEVLPANGPPRISGLPSFVDFVDPPTAFVPFQVSDQANAPETLLVSATSSDPALVPASGIALQGDGASRVLAITPNANQSGAAVITVQVISPTSGSATADLIFAVAAKHEPPSLTLPPDVTLNENQTVRLPFAASSKETSASLLSVTVFSGDSILLPDFGIGLEGEGSDRTLTLTPRPNQHGAARITIQVTDLSGLSSQGSFLVTVLPVDMPPTITMLPDIAVDEDSSIGPLPFVVTDRETPGDQLQVTASTSDPSIIALSGLTLGGQGAERSLIITPIPNRSGIATIRLSAQDGGGQTAVTSFTVTVRPVNDPPTMDALPDLTIRQDSGPVTVALTSISPGPGETQSLTVHAVSSDPTLLPDPIVSYVNPADRGSLTLRPAAGASGRAIIQVTVDDGQPQFNTITRSFVVTVQASNSVPTLSPIADQQINEDASLNLGIVIGDVETPAFLLNVTAATDNPSLVPASNILLSGSGSNRVLTVRPARDRSGVARVTVSVSDGVLSASNTFVLTVVPVNDPPTLDVIADFSTNSVSSNPAYDIGLKGITSGAADENQTLLLTAHSSNLTLLPDPTITYLSPNSAGTLTLRPVKNKTGSAVVTVTVSDGAPTNSTLVRTFLVNIYSSGNSAPVVSAIPDLTIAEDTIPNPIPFTVSDAETPASSLIVTAVSTNQDLLPDANIALSGTGTDRSLTLLPATNRVGTAAVLLTVRDAGFRQRTISFLLTVNPVNDAPTISRLPDQFLLENTRSQPIGFQVADVETAPQNLSVSAHSSNPVLFPDSALLLGGSGGDRAVQLVPAPNQSGTALVTLTVSDGSASARSIFQVTVGPVNTPPSLSAIPDQLTDEDTPSLPIPFQVVDAETPAENLRVAVDSSNPVLLPNAGLLLGGAGANRTLTLIPAPDQNGISIVTVTVSDGSLSRSVAFSLQVNPVNDPPTLDLIPDYRVRQDAPSQTVTLTGLSAGPANENQPLIVTAVSSAPEIVPHPSVTWVQPNQLATLAFAPAAGASGSALISVSVSDGQAYRGTVTRRFTVVVGAAPVLSAPPAQVTLEDVALGPLTIGVADSDGPASSVILHASSSNSNIVENSGLILGGTGTNRTLQVTPVKDAFGPVWITLLASDQDGNAATSGFLLTVLPVNDPPTLDPIPDLVIGQDAEAAQLTLTGIGPGAANEFQSLKVLVETSDPVLLPAPAVLYNSPSTTALLRLGPGPGGTGSASITVIVLDDGAVANGGANRISRHFAVTITNSVPVDRLPSLRLDFGNGSGLLSWPTNGADGYRLLSSTNPVAEWFPVAFPPVRVQRSFLVPVSLDPPSRFFRLCRGCAD